MSRNNRILVPEAREELNNLKAKATSTNDPNYTKYEVANEIGVPLKQGYNGNLTSKQAGKVGGNIGGNMVKEMVKMAEQTLSDKQIKK